MCFVYSQVVVWLAWFRAGTEPPEPGRSPAKRSGGVGGGLGHAVAPSAKTKFVQSSKPHLFCEVRQMIPRSFRASAMSTLPVPRRAFTRS